MMQDDARWCKMMQDVYNQKATCSPCETFFRSRKRFNRRRGGTDLGEAASNFSWRIIMFVFSDAQNGYFSSSNFGIFWLNPSIISYDHVSLSNIVNIVNVHSMFIGEIWHKQNIFRLYNVTYASSFWSLNVNHHQTLLNIITKHDQTWNSSNSSIARLNSPQGPTSPYLAEVPSSAR